MSPTLSLRRKPKPGTGQTEPVDELAAGRATSASARDQVISSLATKAASGALIGCLIAGPLGLAVGGLAFLQAAAPAPAPSTHVTDRSNVRAVAGEFAQRVVVAWLSATRDKPDVLAALVADRQLTSLPEVGYTVSNPTVAAITSHDGVWSVRVAATVTDARKQTARRFYQVPVTVSGGQNPAVAALTLPSPVSAPAVRTGVSLAYRTQVDTSGPVAATVSQFLTAYTAGEGDVTRYVTPGVQMSAISPAPYTSVKVDDLTAVGDVDPSANPADGQVLRVLVSASATVTRQQVTALSYALTLKARAGRWEVAAIDLTPALPQPPAADVADPEGSPSRPHSIPIDPAPPATP